ncbi:MAG TPA: MobF family relaxase [Dermatophilaceae bacterium]|nr:MobF family relaxase [Dermatophilaceae bacterium]
MSSVARADGSGHTASALTRYYAESGTPPGRFLGRGLAGLNNGKGVLVGTTATEEHLFRMLGMLQDPITGEQLGRSPRRGGPAHFDSRGVTRKASLPVAGFDLTFSAPKSVSVVWAVADEATQGRIYAAHQRALEHVIAYAEEHVFSSRSGAGGVVQEDILGVVAAAFDHWDSRAGDPQLHTHVVVMNRVQTTDGVWRTLDSRGLFRSVVGLSEMYNGVLSDYLTEALGWGWQACTRRHSDVPKYEVAGVSERLQEEFSSRSTDIEAAKEVLVAGFVASSGRQPSAREVLKLRQQATLSTRPDKHVRPLAELVDGWRGRAREVLRSDPVAWVETLAGRNDLPLLRAGDLADEMLVEAAKVAVHTVAEKRATFARSNVFAEVLRQFHGVRFATANDRMAVVERTCDLAVGEALLISAPELVHTPVAFQRPDGSSRFRPRGSEIYTTQDLLDAELRLLAASRALGGPSVSPIVAADVCARNLPGKGHPLSAGQSAAVQQIVVCGRVVDVLVGAAGTGKSTAMRGVREAWEREHGPGSVVGLAPSAAAAEVLADVVGIATENTTKWLTEAGRQPQRLAELDQLRAQLHQASPSLRTRTLLRRARTITDEVDRWSLRPGQLVIVDEASMAGTFELDALTEQARNAGAKVLMVGDWAQLSPVAAGGAFHLLAKDRDDVPQLYDVRRFRNEWERDASVELRHGRPDAADTYTEHSRVEGGDRESMLDLLYEAWRDDTRAGKRSLMIANDSQTVLDLNNRARVDRVGAGEVASVGVETASGSVVGMGDSVVTRRNQRGLATGRGWVKNGDQWTVVSMRRDGALDVQRANGTGRATLPAAYVREHVELGYATTAHRAQGRTVDTAHAFVSATTLREPLYVMATRGRESNRLYVDTRYDAEVATSHEPPEELAPVDVLRYVLANSGVDKSATLTISEEWANSQSIARLWAEYDTIARHANEERYKTLVASSGLTPSDADAVRGSEAWGPLMAAFRDAEARGLDLSRALPALVQGRSVSSADDIAALLHGRVSKWLESAAGRVQPDRIVGLFPAACSVTDRDADRALQERRTLIEQNVRALVLEALQRRDPWTLRFGRPPAVPVRREEWLRRLDTIAAYREQRHVNASAVLGGEPRTREQMAQRQAGQHAISTAVAIAHPADLARDAYTTPTVIQPRDR